MNATMLTGFAQASNRAVAQQLYKVVEAAHVRQPVVRGGVRIAALVIEHDGVKIRITPKAHVDCVLLRELPGEAEGTGAGFVVHPLTTERADRLVIAVQRDIATIVQALQAHGQKKAPDLSAHSDVSEKNAVILCLPAAAGKSYLGPMLALQLGLERIIDPWAPTSPITPAALHVTNCLPYQIPVGVTVISWE